MTMHPILEAGRLQNSPFVSTPGEFDGAYSVAMPGQARRICIIASNGVSDNPAMSWQHVSVSFGSVSTKTPSWEIMCWVKDLFWDPEDPVMQLHPPRSRWINQHPGCLHLWRPLPPNPAIPLPPSIMV